LIGNIYNDQGPAPIDLSGDSIIACTFNSNAYLFMSNDIEMLKSDVLGVEFDQITLSLRVDEAEADIFTLRTDVDANIVDIAAHAVRITQNEADIAALQGGTGGHEARITQNELDIADNVTSLDTHASWIVSNTNAIHANDTDIATNAADIIVNSGDIATNAADIVVLDVAVAAVDLDVSFRESAVSALEIGGMISGAGPTSILITAGTGEIINSHTAPSDQVVTDVTWNETVVDLTTIGGMPVLIGLGVTDIALDVTGSVIAFPNGISNSARRSHIKLGRVNYLNLEITAVTPAPMVSNNIGNTFYDLVEFLDSDNYINGLVVRPTEIGDMSIWRDSGQVFVPGINFYSAPDNMNVVQVAADGSTSTGLLMTTVAYNDGSTLTDLIDEPTVPKLYESDGHGTVTGLSNNKSTICYFFQAFGGDYFISYGQKQYDSYAEAVNNLFGDKAQHLFPAELGSMYLLAQIIFSSGTTSWDGITAAIYPINASTSSGSGSGSATQAINITYNDTYSLGNNCQSAIDSLATVRLTATQSDAVAAASSPTGINPFATMADISAPQASSIIFTPAGDIAAINVQAAIEELDTEKSPTGHTHAGVYEPADPTILKDADIGVTVQAWDAILDGTTGTFTTADQSKLDAITGTNTGDQVITLTGEATGSGTGTFAVKVTPDAHTHSTATIQNLSGVNTGDQDLTPYQTVVQPGHIQAPNASPAANSAHAVDYALGNMQKITCPGGSTLSFTFAGFVSNRVSTYIMELVNGGNCTIVWPASIRFPGGVAPALTVTGTDMLSIVRDVNHTLTVSVIGLDVKTL